MLRLILAASLTESAAAVSIAAVTLSEPANASAARSLAVLAVFLTNSRAASGTSMFWRFFRASVTGAKASFTLSSTGLVSVVIWVSPSSGFELWAHPVRIGPGRDPCGIVNGAAQHQCCDAISRNRDHPVCWAFAQPAGLLPNSLVQPIGLELGLELRDIVPEHDDIVLFAVDIAHMVAQQRLGLEAEAFEQRDRAPLVHRHLHRELFQPGAQCQGKRLLRQRAPDALPTQILRHHHPDLADMR